MDWALNLCVGLASIRQPHTCTMALELVFLKTITGKRQTLNKTSYYCLLSKYSLPIQNNAACCDCGTSVIIPEGGNQKPQLQSLMIHSAVGCMRSKRLKGRKINASQTTGVLMLNKIKFALKERYGQNNENTLYTREYSSVISKLLI